MWFWKEYMWFREEYMWFWEEYMWFWEEYKRIFEEIKSTDTISRGWIYDESRCLAFYRINPPDEFNWRRIVQKCFGSASIGHHSCWYHSVKIRSRRTAKQPTFNKENNFDLSLRTRSTILEQKRYAKSGLKIYAIFRIVTHLNHWTSVIFAFLPFSL